MNLKRAVAVGVVLSCAGGALWAQTRVDESGGSLAALTAEVRLLRLAVEDGTKRQAEVQALGVSLSAQQSRMIQLNARIDAVRSEIAAAESRAKQGAFFVQNAQEDIQTNLASADPDERREAAEMLQLFKQQADEATAAMDRLRSRESDLTQAMRIEEQRWSDLINRLEQAVRK
jgi:hypothetical protein